MNTTRMVDMNQLKFLIIVISSIVFIVACSHTPNKPPVTQNTKKVSTITKIANSQGEQIAGIAQSMLGKPYKYGGKSPNGFDCSGLVYYSHSKLGISTPRTSSQQHRHSTPVALSQLQTGDLVFFTLNSKNISHVGIYVGDNQFIHAPKSGKRVSVSYLNDPYWKTRVVGGGRFY